MFCIHVCNTYRVLLYTCISFTYETRFFFLLCHSTTTTDVLKCVLGFICQAPPIQDDVEMSQNVLEAQAVPLRLQRSSQLSDSDVRWVQLTGSASVAIGKERTMSIRVQGIQAKQLPTPEDFDVWNFLFLMLQFFWRIIQTTGGKT